MSYDVIRFYQFEMSTKWKRLRKMARATAPLRPTTSTRLRRERLCPFIQSIFIIKYISSGRQKSKKKTYSQIDIELRQVRKKNSQSARNVASAKKKIFYSNTITSIISKFALSPDLPRFCEVEYHTHATDDHILTLLHQNRKAMLEQSSNGRHARALYFWPKI